MSDLNSVCFTGNLTKQAELKTTSGGCSISEFTLACNGSEKDKEGKWVERPDFFDCKLIGKRAAALNQYLTQGQKVSVEGRLRQDRWKDNDGNNHYRIRIVVDNLVLCGGRKPEHTAPESSSMPEPDDDIPM